MSTRFSIPFLSFYIFLLGCATSRSVSNQQDQLSAKALFPFGRNQINNDQKLELISSAAHFGFSFEGTECRITASLPAWLNHNYLQYELDGIYQKRLRVSSRPGEPIVITAPNEGKHTVWIYKATEAHTGPVYINEVRANKIKALQRPSAPLIEFIGNSITCGAAADPSEVPCGTGVYHDQHNAYMAYGPRVARALNANYIVSSVSGIGMYRNWNSDNPIMPNVYEKIDFQEQNTKQWNFAAYAPQVVSIALGTNDLSRGDGKKTRLPFDSAIFVNNYIQFIKLVRSKYPAAQIVLLSSPMANGDDRILLQSCLTSVREKINASGTSFKPVELFFFQPMQARGCTGHPNVKDHEVMANELIPFFKKIMN
jgi:hypothetical protein